MPFTAAAHSARWPYVSDDEYRARLKARTVVNEKGCWLWQGFIHKEPNPYGETSYRSVNWRVHRLAYFLWKGPLDPALDICHDCDVKHCCNPDHLWQGTPKANMQDAATKRIWSRQHQTACKRGHEFTPENVYYAPSSPTKRQCRQCMRLRARKDPNKAARQRRRRAKLKLLQSQLT